MISEAYRRLRKKAPSQRLNRVLKAPLDIQVRHSLIFQNFGYFIDKLPYINVNLLTNSQDFPQAFCSATNIVFQDWGYVAISEATQRQN